MLGLLARIAETARSSYTSCAEHLESRGVPLETLAGPSHTARRHLQTFDFPPPPSILDDLRALGIPHAYAEELNECFFTAVVKMHSLVRQSYERLDAKLCAMPGSDPTSRTKLHGVMLQNYMTRVAQLRERHLESARRHVRRDSPEKAPFQQEVKSTGFRPLRLLNIAQKLLRILEHSFAANPNPSSAEKILLADETGRTLRQIDVWVCVYLLSEIAHRRP
jgi:hypothetical protein